MKIAIESHLSSIRDLLHNQHYDIYTFSSSLKTPVSVIIYEEKVLHNGLLSYTSPSKISNNICISSGTLLINAYNKSPEEVLEILENRLYSPLF